MKYKLSNLAGVMGALLSFGTLEAADNILTPEDTFNLERTISPIISPDGSKIVYTRGFYDIMTDRGKTNLWTINSDGTNHRPLTSGTNSNSQAHWSPDGSKLVYVSNVEGKSQIFMRWMDNGQTASITKLTSGPGNLTWSPDGKYLAFNLFVPADKPSLHNMPGKPSGAEWAAPVKTFDAVYYRGDGRGYITPGYTHVFVVPTEGGTPRQVTSGNYHHRGAISFSPDGETMYLSANRRDDWELNTVQSDIYALNVKSGEYTRLTDRDGPDGSPTVSPDGKLIAYTGFDDRSIGTQISRLYLMNSDGSGKRELLNIDRSVGNLHWKGDGTGLYFQYTSEGKGNVAFTTLSGAVDNLVDNMGGMSTGRPYAAGTYNVNAEGDIVFTSGNGENLANVAIIDENGSVQQLTRVNEDLFGHKEVGKVEELWWNSSFDGRRVQGWIIKPPGFNPNKKYPMVLEIHGGPHSAYGPYFSMELQLMAAQGYVVFYTNPRGSTSYGQEFAELIQYNYPGQDYDDLISGTDAVIDLGYVDENNLFVTGGSGGGVLTAWIVGKTDKFRAAVSAKPVINWYSFALTADGYATYTKRWFKSMPWEDPDEYMDRSPISLVGNVTTPTMLMTGESDMRTPPSEAEQFYQALKLQGVDSAMVRVPGATHGIASRPSHLIAKIGNIMGWFEKYRTKKTDNDEPVS
ncbi:MAG: S9 family peptidase [Sphingomonadales bacterium]